MSKQFNEIEVGQQFRLYEDSAHCIKTFMNQWFEDGILLKSNAIVQEGIEQNTELYLKPNSMVFAG